MFSYIRRSLGDVAFAPSFMTTDKMVVCK
jgi:hypothetical protein